MLPDFDSIAGLRPVQPADTPAVHALIASIFADYGDTLDVEREDPHLQTPGPYFRASGGEFWVVEADGRIVATCAVALHADAGELKSLYVAHAQRGRGLGRRLTELAMAHARSAGRTRMTLWSDTRFTEAHRLYERLGFVRGGRREMQITNTFAEFAYERTL